MAAMIIWIIILIRFYTLITFMQSLLFHLINFGVYVIFIYTSSMFLAGISAITYVGMVFIQTTNEYLLCLINKQDIMFINHIVLATGVQKFIIPHNTFCQLYYIIFKLMSKLLLAYFMTLMPLNLILIHQFLFEELALEYKLYSVLLIGMMTLTTIITQYTVAHLSLLTHRTAVPLSRLQLRLKGLPFGLRHKIKVMSYFERLSSNRKFGITIGPTITLTMPVFSQVYY